MVRALALCKTGVFGPGSASGREKSAKKFCRHLLSPKRHACRYNILIYKYIISDMKRREIVTPSIAMNFGLENFGAPHGSAGNRPDTGDRAAGPGDTRRMTSCVRAEGGTEGGTEAGTYGGVKRGRPNGPCPEAGHANRRTVASAGSGRSRHQRRIRPAAAARSFRRRHPFAVSLPSDRRPGWAIPARSRRRAPVDAPPWGRHGPPDV